MKNIHEDKKIFVAFSAEEQEVIELSGGVEPAGETLGEGKR